MWYADSVTVRRVGGWDQDILMTVELSTTAVRLVTGAPGEGEYGA